jgi:hypothetical protein
MWVKELELELLLLLMVDTALYKKADAAANWSTVVQRLLLEERRNRILLHGLFCSCGCSSVLLRHHTAIDIVLL